MGVISRVKVRTCAGERLPLAKSKGVYCEVESEGNWRQMHEPSLPWSFFKKCRISLNLSTRRMKILKIYETKRSSWIHILDEVFQRLVPICIFPFQVRIVSTS